MSIITTLMEDGLSAAFKLVPWYYTAGAAAVVLAGLLIWAKIWFDNKVEAEAQKEINAYIATQKKDDAELKEITLRNNNKIQVQYRDRVVTVTKIVHDNSSVIAKTVPDTAAVSNGYVAAYNSIVVGSPIDTKSASDATPSGLTDVDVLKNDNANYGTCQLYKAQAEMWQTWYQTQQATVAAQNKKDK
jgi:hypothetical protein